MTVANLPLKFGQPWLLLLLLLLPWFILFARHSRSGLERGRAIFGTIVRVLLFVAIVFSLADANWVSRTYRTATIFLLDHSYSIPQEIQKGATDWINDQLKKLPKDDVGGVILFGNEAMIETSPSETPVPVGPNSVVGRAATDLGAAIRLALAVFPQGYQRRIVVVSDGNENKGHALAEVELARAHGVVIDVFALRYDYPGEVWIEGLHVPPDILPKEPFEATAVVNSQREGPAKLSIYRNGELLTMQSVQLNKGKNVFTVKQRVEGAGSFQYKAVVEMQGDVVSQNNEAHAYAAARGEAKVAVVAGEPVDGETLVKALREEGIECTVFSPEEMLRGVAQLASFDAVIFANVEAAQVTRGGMQAVEAAVHDAGVGFIMIGGERSYGPGGYRGSPIEELLPVTMEQPQRRVLPNGALCLILHTCEIPEGNFWAKQIGIAALNVLNSRDYMGVIIYGAGEQWLYPMQLVNKPKMSGLINSASPGDMPDFDATMKMAHAGLKAVSAVAKHLIVISDADPSGPSRKLVDDIVADKITITTIAIFPHGSSDVDKMASIATVGKGRFYNVNDPAKLPQIFIKEAATLQRSMIIEGKIPPVMLGWTGALKGIGAESGLPPLYGYTLTTPKPSPLVRLSLGAPIAKEGGDEKQYDALLVEWTYGLGKTMAFTSDAKPRWAKDWVVWENYKKFWSQAVRSVLRTVPRAPYQVHTEIEGGKGKVVIDAMDESGKFNHTLQFNGSVTAPDGAKSQLPFRQSGPGRYEAEFDASDVGVYSVIGAFQGAHGEKGYITQGVPLSYVAEYRDLKTNVALLDQLRERTGGRKLGKTDVVYAKLPNTAGMAMPLWPILLAALLALWPIDIFVRRVAVDFGEIAGRAWARIKRGRPARPVEMPATLAALTAKKQEVRAEIKPAELVAPRSAPVDLERLSGAAPRSPAPSAEAAPPAPAAPAAPGAPDFMQRLLDAKKKAQKKE